MRGESVATLLGSGTNKLSRREQEIFQLIVEGKTTRQAACELGITLKTASNYRQRILSKLNVHNTADLAGTAIGLEVPKPTSEPVTCRTYRSLVRSIEVHLLRISQYSFAARRAIGAADETRTDELQRQIAAALEDVERAIGALKQHRSEHGCPLLDPLRTAMRLNFAHRSFR
jgi:DNA-binding CsgD family transcriptional regulator